MTGTVNSDGYVRTGRVCTHRAGYVRTMLGMVHPTMLGMVHPTMLGIPPLRVYHLPYHPGYTTPTLYHPVLHGTLTPRFSGGGEETLGSRTEVYPGREASARLRTSRVLRLVCSLRVDPSGSRVRKEKRLDRRRVYTP